MTDRDKVINGRQTEHICFDSDIMVRKPKMTSQQEINENIKTVSEKHVT